MNELAYNELAEALGKITMNDKPKKALLSALRTTNGDVRAACKIAGISHASAYRWKKADPQFARAWLESSRAEVARPVSTLVDGQFKLKKRDPFSMTMTCGEWFAVPANPIQRDTEKHATKAKGGHLAFSIPAHAIVTAAMLPDGSMVKIDGHSRAFLWSNGDLAPPRSLCVNVLPVANIEEAVFLYKTYDSQSAVETGADRIAGAFRLADLSAQSDAVVRGGITGALSLLLDPGQSREMRSNIYDAVGEWKAEITLLDGLTVTRSKFPSFIVAAALATFRVRGKRVARFWTSYSGGNGTKIDGESDGIQALEGLRLTLRGKGQSVDLNRMNAGKAVYCCEAWLQDRSLKRVLETDILKYIASS